MADRTNTPDTFEAKDGHEVSTYTLKEGEFILNRCSTKRPRLYGPATVTVVKWPDGGYDYTVRD